MDCQSLYRLSRIQAPSRGTGRIQRKVYVRSDDFARGLLCHASGSRTCNLSELLSTRNALAIHRNTLSGLNGLSWYGYRDKARDQLPSVLDIRLASVSGRLRSVQTCESIHSSQEGVSFAAGCESEQRRLALRLLSNIPHVLRRPQNKRYEQKKYQ
jgi:hypothetical protein